MCALIAKIEFLEVESRRCGVDDGPKGDSKHWISWFTGLPKAKAWHPGNAYTWMDPLHRLTMASFPIRAPKLLPLLFHFCSAPIFSFSVPCLRGPCLAAHLEFPPQNPQLGDPVVARVCRTITVCSTPGSLTVGPWTDVCESRLGPSPPSIILFFRENASGFPTTYLE